MNWGANNLTARKELPGAVENERLRQAGTGIRKLY